MRLEFYNPSGKTEITSSHAPRLSSLSNKRIGFLSNADWQSSRSFPALKSHLEADIAGVELLPLDTDGRVSHCREVLDFARAQGAHCIEEHGGGGLNDALNQR
jgi:hypothetical protein